MGEIESKCEITDLNPTIHVFTLTLNFTLNTNRLKTTIKRQIFFPEGIK